MKYDWMDAYVLKKRGVTKDFQPAWNWIRYHVGGKMFAAICLDQKKNPYYITLKLDPVRGVFCGHNMRTLCRDIIRIRCTGIRSARMGRCRIH